MEGRGFVVWVFLEVMTKIMTEWDRMQWFNGVWG